MSADEGRDNWALIGTLIESHKIAGTAPHARLAETLVKLANGHPAERCGERMP